MKRFIGLLMCLLMIAGCLSVSQTDEGEHEEVIIDTKKIEYLTDEQLSLLYSCKQDIRKKDDSIVELSQSDAWLLMQVGRCEGGETIEGQFWVMRSIYNRYLLGIGSISEILNADKQYAVVKNGTYLKADINANTHFALALLESGYDPTDGAIYFESNTNSDNSWHKQNLTFVKEVQGNLYYK